jgi:hypothetical protein
MVFYVYIICLIGVVAMEPLADFTHEAIRVVELAEKKGIILRVMGACAVGIHCPKYEYLYKKLGRELSDIDFFSYSRFQSETRKFLEDLDYKPREYIFKYWERAGLLRQIYDDEKNKRVVDIFFDELSMCHTIDFRGRLELDYPTITLGDLLLEKMQIVKLTEKDIKDVIVLLREHEVGAKDKETVNAKYVANLLSNDWGFYYTVTTNLNQIREFSKKYEALTKEDCSDVSTKVDELLQAIRKEPKSLKWKIREKIGTRKKWYTEVEEAVLPGTAIGNQL